MVARPGHAASGLPGPAPPRFRYRCGAPSGVEASPSDAVVTDGFSGGPTADPPAPQAVEATALVRSEQDQVGLPVGGGLGDEEVDAVAAGTLDDAVRRQAVGAELEDGALDQELGLRRRQDGRGTPGTHELQAVEHTDGAMSAPDELGGGRRQCAVVVEVVDRDQDPTQHRPVSCMADTPCCGSA